MADPRADALRSILERNAGGGLGVRGGLDVSLNPPFPQPPPAKTPLTLAGGKMRSMGEQFPLFGGGGGVEYTLGAQGQLGGYQLGGSATLSKDERQFEVMARSLGVDPQELRMWLAMRGTDPSRVGASYTGQPVSASAEAVLPEGERAVSGEFSYNLGDAGSVGARGKYDIEDPRRSSLMGTYKTSF